MQLEEIFEVVNCDGEKKVLFATFMLKGEAKHWWRATRGTLPLEDGQPVTWDVFLGAFWGNYFPTNVCKKKELEFIELTQGNLTILQYKAKFMELAHFTPHIVADEECKAMKFKRGLKPNIRIRMSALRLRTFIDVAETARIVERYCDELQHIQEKDKKRSRSEIFHEGK